MATQRSFHHAIKWSFAGIWGEKALVSLFTVILASLLGPKDFGLVGIAWVFVNFIQMFLDQGLVAALIQKKDLQQEHLDSVFWMDLALSVLLVIGSVLLSRWWAKVNGAPQVAHLISALSICIPIEGLAIVQKTVLYRSMDFKTLSIRSTIAVLISGIVGVVMAWAKYGAWALVGQQVSKDLISLALLWRLSSWRPRFSFSWTHLRQLMGFSLSNFAAQLGIFADTQTGSILVGVFFGPVPVGLYRLADRIMNSVVGACTSSIQTVSLPEFSRLQDKPVELRQSALTCIRLSSTITLPALACLGMVSVPLMACVGPQWIPAAGVLKVLCLLGMVIIFAYFTGPLLQALSKPHQLAILEWLRAAAGVLFLILAGFVAKKTSINTQILAIAFARLATGALLVTPAFLYILMRLTGVSIRDIAGAVAPSLAACVAIVIVIFAVQSLPLIGSLRATFALSIEVLAGILVAAPLVLMLDPNLRRSWQRALNSPRVSSSS